MIHLCWTLGRARFWRDNRLFPEARKKEGWWWQWWNIKSVGDMMMANFVSSCRTRNFLPSDGKTESHVYRAATTQKCHRDVVGSSPVSGSHTGSRNISNTPLWIELLIVLSSGCESVRRGRAESPKHITFLSCSDCGEKEASLCIQSVRFLGPTKQRRQFKHLGWWALSRALML